MTLFIGEKAESNAYLSLIYDASLVPFAIGCGIASVAFMVVDYALFLTNNVNESLLKIRYQKNNFLFLLITWFCGAFVVGYFATYIAIFNTSKQSLVTLGVLWPLALKRIIDNAGTHLGSNDDAEEIIEEDEE